MLQTVDVGERSLEAYRGVASEPILEEILRQAKPLRGARLPRLLLNELSLMGGLARERPVRHGPVARRDPVCGMAVGEVTPELVVTVDNRTYFFCSEACRARFLEVPERYTGEELGQTQLLIET